METANLHQAITQTNRNIDVSDRYTHINTADIIAHLESKGFELYNTQVAGARKESNKGFQKHMITMKYNKLATADGVPTILIFNSHNRSTGLRIYVGYVKFACLNGLISGSSIEELRVQHSSNWKDRTEEFISTYEETTKKLLAEYTTMQQSILSQADILNFATIAMKLRYEDDLVLDPLELALIRREEDKSRDVFTIYNRIQEALLAGEFQRRVRTINPDNGVIEYSKYGKAKKITDSKEILRINQSLHQLALLFTTSIPATYKLLGK